MAIRRQRASSMQGRRDSRHASRAEVVQQDADELADVIGHNQELVRQFGPWTMFALAFSVLGTWSTLAQNLSTGISNGGPVTILWGLVLVTICNICVAVSLGELLSAMPTALGQAYWIYRLWTTPTGRFLSYLCAWINTFGWWALTASQSAFMTEFILALKVIESPDWAPATYGWVNFLLYVAITVLLTIINATSCRKDNVLPWINSFVGITFIGLFFVFILGLLISVGVRSGLNFQPASFVFAEWLNQTGWPSGVTWFTGLVQSAYGLTAFDACIHMIEELPNASKTGPFILWLSVLTGAISGFIFMMVCLFSIVDMDAVLAADYPFIQLCLDSMGAAAATTLLALFVISGIGQNISLTTSASRLTWSFARDGGLPFHRYFSVVNKKWKVPVRAVYGQGVIIGLIGILYLFANTVLQAILSVSTIALTVSYAMPIVVLLIVGRDKLPKDIPFRLGRSGTTINVISIIYCVVTTVFFFFPDGPNPAAADMNWAIAVFGIMLIVALGFWFIQGHKSYLRTNNALLRIVTGQEDSNGAGLHETMSRPQVSKTRIDKT
ncbi:hypothetical protein PMZ80_005543 [Knufia obscura]|uniref:Choline transport protein n=2 Tax=Knufia TaxID=430999 RepID=A0AAN8I1V3_9EURO|nr:hypothetical protein PMZ80_005543 [Knufia obscura]KAK5950012.1 hypothetical protein OHC33_008973 [Knufia fluminis]